MNCTTTTLFLITALGASTVGLARSPDVQGERRMGPPALEQQLLLPGPALPATPSLADAWSSGLSPRPVGAPALLRKQNVPPGAETPDQPIRTRFGGAMAMLVIDAPDVSQPAFPSGPRALLHIESDVEEVELNQAARKVLVHVLDTPPQFIPGRGAQPVPDGPIPMDASRAAEDTKSPIQE